MKNLKIFLVLLIVGCTAQTQAQKLGNSYLPPQPNNAATWVSMLYQKNINAF